MTKKKVSENIEEGLFNFYLDKEDSAYKMALEEEGIDIAERGAKYERLAKRILFSAKAKAKEQKLAKVISIAEASGRLKEVFKTGDSNVISIFNQHIEKYGLLVNYRNLDKMDEVELGEIIGQLDITVLLNDIEASLKNE